MKIHHKHDCNICIHLGSEDEGKVDYYYCTQRGQPTLIARFGPEEHYASGMCFYAMDYSINRAGNLALEQGHITLDQLIAAHPSITEVTYLSRP